MILEASPGALNILIRNVVLHVYRAGSCQQFYTFLDCQRLCIENNSHSLIALENSNNNCIINTVAMIEEVTWKCIAKNTNFLKITNP